MFFPTLFQLLHELAHQQSWVSLADVGWLTLKRVTDGDRDWYVLVLDRERRCRILPLIAVAVRLEIIQYRVWVAFCFGSGKSHVPQFTSFARPSLDNVVACTWERFSSFYCGLVCLFACFVAFFDHFVTIVRETFSAPVPVAAVVLKYGLCFVAVSVDRCSLNPPLSSVTAHRVVNVEFTTLVFLLESP